MWRRRTATLAKVLVAESLRRPTARQPLMMESFVQGSALNEADLFRAGILTAQKLVMLAPDHRPDSTGMEGLIDAKTIFAYQLVMQLRPGISVVLEIIHSENVMFLDSSHKQIDEHYRFTSQFASGCLFLFFPQFLAFSAALLNGGVLFDDFPFPFGSGSANRSPWFEGPSARQCPQSSSLSS